MAELNEQWSESTRGCEDGLVGIGHQLISLTANICACHLSKTSSYNVPGVNGSRYHPGRTSTTTSGAKNTKDAFHPVAVITRNY